MRFATLEQLKLYKNTEVTLIVRGVHKTRNVFGILKDWSAHRTYLEKVKDAGPRQITEKDSFHNGHILSITTADGKVWK
jgi:hypothetical protein